METHMNRLTTTLLGASMFTAFAIGAYAQPHPSMPMPQPSMPMPRQPAFGTTFDPDQLPETKGAVAQYTLAPWGEIDGLILADGTEVHLPPRLSSALVYAVHPGDTVSIRGLRAKAIPMVDAVTVTNSETGVVVGGQPNHERQEVTGVVKATLHSPRGDADGVLLADGTAVRLPPQEATRLAAMLAPGQTVVVRGEGVTSPLGHVIAVREIGPSADKLTKVGRPHMMDMHNMHDHAPHNDDKAPQ
jgi:hypothetical protein